MASLLIKSNRDGTDVTFGDNQVISVPIIQDTIFSRATLFELLMNDPKMYQVLNLDDNSLNRFNASTTGILMQVPSASGTSKKVSISHRKIAIVKPASTKITKENFNARFFKAIINYLSLGLAFSNIRITDFSILNSTLNDPIPTAIFTGIDTNFGEKPFFPEKLSIPSSLIVARIRTHTESGEISTDEHVRIHYATIWAICCNALEVASGKKNLFLGYQSGDDLKILAAIVGSYGFPGNVKNEETVLSKSGMEFKITADPATFQIVQDQELARDSHSCFASVLQGLNTGSYKMPKFVQNDYITEIYAEKMFYVYNARKLTEEIVKVGAHPLGGEIIKFDQDTIFEIVKLLFTPMKNSVVNDKLVVEELRKLMKMDFREMFTGA